MTRENNLRTRLDSGEIAIGASSGLYSATVIELFSDHDLDFLFIDFEHNGPSVWDSLRIEEFVRAAEHADIELLLRLPSGIVGEHAPMIRTVLDTGIKNVVIPRVKTADEVRRAIKATQFRYQGDSGERGVGAARGSDWGSDITEQWIDAEDAETLCGIMVETENAVENIDEIVSVPGLGFVFVGSMDLSVALGVPTDTENTRFRSAVERVRSACHDANIPFGQLGDPTMDVADFIAAGDRLIRAGSDIGAIKGAFSEDYSQYR